jgi:outer membrane protein assembly factor BamB
MSSAYGTPTVANNIVFAPSLDNNGTVFFLDSNNGNVLFKYETGIEIAGGVVIDNGNLYIPSGTKYPGAGQSSQGSLTVLGLKSNRTC